MVLFEILLDFALTAVLPGLAVTAIIIGFTMWVLRRNRMKVNHALTHREVEIRQQRYTPSEYHRLTYESRQQAHAWAAHNLLDPGMILVGVIFLGGIGFLIPAVWLDIPTKAMLVFGGIGVMLCLMAVAFFKLLQPRT